MIMSTGALQFSHNKLHQMLVEIYATSLYWFPYRRGIDPLKRGRAISPTKEAEQFLDQHNRDIQSLQQEVTNK